MRPIRILLAEDHDLVGAGIRSLLENLPEVRVVAEAGDGYKALQLVEEDHPGVVLMDITMPFVSDWCHRTRATATSYPLFRSITPHISGIP